MFAAVPPPGEAPAWSNFGEADPALTAARDARLRSLVGEVVADRYEVSSVLATGGMATVFVAWDRRLERDVALKVLRPALAAQDGFTERFRQEARLLSRVDHPNCLRALEFLTTDDELHVLVTELVDGVELAELIRRPVPAERAVERCRQILAGLQHAHAAGVVHRDLKPENILVTQRPDGTEHLTIVDFGIAKLMGKKAAALTAVGVVLGTPQYLSPEQASAQAVDHRSDLYAVGVLLHSMLTGRDPFVGRPGDVVRAQIDQAPPPLPLSTPAPLSRVVMRLLAKDRDQRFYNAREASEALAAAVGPGPTSAPRRRRPRMFIPAKWHAPLATAAGAVALGCLFAAALLESPGPL
jgi:serine/threonine-protein kinase